MIAYNPAKCRKKGRIKYIIQMFIHYVNMDGFNMIK